jgi:hypothetical protein
MFDIVNPNPDAPAAPQSASPAALAVQQHVTLLADPLRGSDRHAELEANVPIMRRLIFGGGDA